VEALAEHELPVDDPHFTLGNNGFYIPVRLNTGDYAESWGEGPIKVFDRNGSLLASMDPVGDRPNLQPGENKIVLKTGNPATVKLTLITTGEPVNW
jgi:hypothetical protein